MLAETARRGDWQRGARARRPRTWTAASLVTGALAALAAPAGAGAAPTQRYASPTGAGTGCTAPGTSPGPCPLSNAINEAGPNEEVIVAGDQGSYGTRGSPLSTPLQAINTIAVAGAAGQPRPVIFMNTAFGLNMAQGGSVANLDLESIGNGFSLAGAGTVDHVMAVNTGGGGGCGLSGTSTIVDTLCSSTAGAGFFLAAGVGPPTQSLTVRNATFYGGNYGMQINFTGPVAFGVSATNTIVHGVAFQDISAAASSGATVGVTLDHSNYATTTTSGMAEVTAAGSGTNQIAAPLFANVTSGDLHEAPGSPTIDAGLTGLANGTTDLDGNPRTIGPATDIGAYEAAEAPTIAPGAVTGLDPHDATINAAINPNFSAATFHVDYGPTSAYGSSTAAQGADAGVSPLAVSVPLGGLSPNTRYHYRVLAANALGTSSTPDATFTTPPLPSSVSLPPLLSRLKLSPRRLVAAGRGGSIARRRKSRGAVVSYSDSEPALTTFTVLSPRRGFRVGAQCRAERPRRHTGKLRRCTRFVAVGSFTHRDVVGANHFHFTGRVKHKRLVVGRYRLQAVARNAAGQTSRAQTTSFRVIR